MLPSFTPFDGFTVFPAALSAVWTTWNVLGGWPSDTTTATAPPGPVSVLIPARNEAAHIEDAVRAALAALGPDDELLVCDDGSTDGTRTILASIADLRLRVLDGAPLAPGEVGKPRACAQLADAARGRHLLFVDADVTLAPDAIARLSALQNAYQADVVTAFPDQRMETWAERVLLPMLPLTFTSWMPLDAIWRRPEPWLLVVNGQLLWFERDTYEAIGGFRAVVTEVVDDMAICRNAKLAGRRVVFATARHAAACRMYEGHGAMWAGFSKNLYEGLGERPWAVALVITLYLSAFVLPYVRFAAEWAWSTPTWEAALGLACALWARGVLATRLGHSPWSVVAHPIAAVWACAVALNSVRWARRGEVQWRGRTYVRREDRGRST